MDQGSLKGVEWLLDNGASPTTLPIDGSHTQILKRDPFNLATLQLFMKKESDSPFKFSREKRTNALINFMRSDSQDLALIENMLKRGIDPKAPALSSSYCSLLCHGIFSFNVEVIKLLFQHKVVNMNEGY